MRLALATLLLAATASAQTFEAIVAVRVDEPPTSARTTAMGGASDALSPDGTDLAVNPALSASLKKTTLSLSGARSTYDVIRYDVDGFDIIERRDPRSQSALAHAAVAVPLRGFVVGFYARNEPRIVRHPVDQGIVSDDDWEPHCVGEDCAYVLAGAGAWDRRDRRYGVTAAFERGSLAFGAGAELQDLDEQYEMFRVSLRVGNSAMDRILRSTSARKVVPNAGVRWRVSPRIAIAAAYNGAATREHTDDVCTSAGPPSYECRTRIERIATWKTKGVDAYRAAITVAPVERLVVTAEAVRRNHSRIGAEELDLVGALIPVRHRDTTDLHAGAEYRLRNLPVSLRAGWQRQPSKIEEGAFVPTPTLEHRTYGAGIDVGAARIDLAYDDADTPALRRAVVGVTFAVR